MLPITEAAQQQFASNTVEELRAYAKELGIEDQIKQGWNGDKIRALLLSQLGLEFRATSQVQSTPRIVSKGEAIFPEYNLTPNGVWGGRRHRLKLPRPDGSKLDNAAGFGWNGKHTYYIPYDEVVSVPEPIYNLIRDNKRRRSYQKRTTLQDGSVEITTAWEFDDVAFSYYGVDAETKDLAGSMMEWYQMKGPTWFEKRSYRELQLIAARIELPLRHLNVPAGTVPPPYTQEDALAALKTFFFGYPDATEAKEGESEKAA